MKAIILAAGKGKRIGSITDKKPKALLKVNNKPILAYQIDALIKNGITEIIICIGYLYKIIEEFCKKNYPHISIKFIYNKRYEFTNNMYSFYLAREYLDEDIILMNGDVVFDERIIKKIIETPGNLVPAEKNAYNEESMKIKLDKEGCIIDIAKTITDGYGCSIDIYKFLKEDVEKIKDEMIRIIEKENIGDVWTEIMLQNLFNKKEILAKPLDIEDMKWCEIDNIEDLNKAELMFNESLSKLKKKNIFLLDVDGTILLGNKLFPGVNEFISKLKNKNKNFYILTNNSSKTPDTHLEILSQSGLEIDKKNILVSTDGLIKYLKKENYEKIYLIANQKVSAYFKEKGFNLVSEAPEAVVLTYDTEINYEKLKKACSLLNQDIPYFATHIDIVCPTSNGNIPDIGTFIKTIELTTGKLPKMTFGKPYPGIIDFIPKEDAVFIGDRIYTDIKLAKNVGILSVLVLSGETKREDVEFSDIQPDIIIKNISDLIDYV